MAGRQALYVLRVRFPTVARVFVYNDGDFASHHQARADVLGR